MRGQAKVGVGVIVRKRNKILMIKRKGSHGAGSWSCPGGHIEFGESIEACARRECLEETGVSLDALIFLGITNDIFESDEKHYVTLWMQGEYASGQPEIASEKEVEAIGWFEWNALPEPLFLPMQHFIEGHFLKSEGEAK
jgi:8-oxo-dGTP diphosphatase